MHEGEDANQLEPRRYPQVVRAVFETPWAIVPSYLRAIVEVVELRISGERMPAEEVEARIGAGPSMRQPAQAGSVAVLPVYGVVMPRATLFSQISGGCSMTSFQAQLQAAVEDPNVASILLDVDSPGGSSFLVPETAAAIRAANEQKPVVGVANSMAASAAYYLLSQCSEVYVTPSGMVGSIGVYCAHEDTSGLQEKLGVKTTLISAGKYKTEGNEYEPLSSDARDALQSIVDDMYAMFVNDVAKGRGVSASAVRNGFGQGRVVTAQNALDEGMVDGVATFGEVLQKMLGDAQRGGTTAGARAAAPDLEPKADAGAAPTPALELTDLGDLAGLLRQTNATLSTPEGTDD